MSLNTRPLSYHGDGGQHWADAAVQINGGFNNSLPGLCLLLCAALQNIGSRHIAFIALMRAFNIDLHL